LFGFRFKFRARIKVGFRVRIKFRVRFKIHLTRQASSVYMYLYVEGGNKSPS